MFMYTLFSRNVDRYNLQHCVVHAYKVATQLLQSAITYLQISISASPFSILNMLHYCYLLSCDDIALLFDFEFFRHDEDTRCSRGRYKLARGTRTRAQKSL
jgi:hypothetical protein